MSVSVWVDAYVAIFTPKVASLDLITCDETWLANQQCLACNVAVDTGSTKTIDKASS